MVTEITFITGNENKAKQVGKYLQMLITHHKLDLVEVQSVDLEEVVEHKAREAYRQIGRPVLVEDMSLTFKAMGRLPGPLIKWFLQELGNDGLCRLVDSYQDRRVTARVLFGLYDGGDRVMMFDGEVEGVVAKSPQGEKSFGWDPIFIPIGWDKAWGAMNEEELAHTSMRKIALAKLQDYLDKED